MGVNIRTNPTAFGEICSSSNNVQQCPNGECLNPISGICEHGVSCFVNPCEVNICPLAAICEANYCGGCHAVFKDTNGNIIDPANCHRNSLEPVGCGINHC